MKRVKTGEIKEQKLALRLDAPVGTYKVDAHVRTMFPRTAACGIALLRDDVNRAARIAIMREHQERIEQRAARDRAERLLGLLENIEREAAGLFPIPVDDVAEIADGFASPASARHALVQIIEDINALLPWAAELRRIGIANPPPSRSDPLGRFFIDEMAKAYAAPARRGERAPNSRGGPFVDLVAAAWLDLGFPAPPKKSDDLREWLGTKVQRRRRAHLIPENS